MNKITIYHSDGQCVGIRLQSVNKEIGYVCQLQPHYVGSKFVIDGDMNIISAWDVLIINPEV